MLIYGENCSGVLMIIRHSARTSKWGIQSLSGEFRVANLRAGVSRSRSLSCSPKHFLLSRWHRFRVQVRVIGSGVSGSGRWCINRVRDKEGLLGSRIKLAGRPTSALGHPIARGAGQPSFRFLRRECASAQRGTDQGLVAKHRGFHE